MSFFCRKASRAGIWTCRFGVRKPSLFLLPRGGPSGGEGAANTSRADEVETPHWEQSEVCMQWELLCEMQSFLGEVNHLSSSVRVEESWKIAGWEGTAGPAPAGALRAEPLASRSDTAVHPWHMPFTGSHSRASHYGQEGRFHKAKQARSFCSI